MTSLQTLIRKLRSNCPSIKILNNTLCFLRTNEVTDEIVTETANALRTNQTIVSLSLQGAKGSMLSEKQWQILLEEGFTHHPSLQHIRFERNNILSVQGFTILTNLFERNQLLLTSLDIIDIALPVNDIITFFNCLRSSNNTTLEHLLLVNCFDRNIRSDLQRDDDNLHLGQSIRQFLHETTTLKSFGLSKTNLGSRIGIEIAKGLQFNTSLQSFKYESNELHNDGAIAIANALRTNRQIQLSLLWIGSNNIEDDGIIALCQSFQYQSYLTEVSLRNNYITSRALHELGKSLRYNTTIQRFDYIGMRNRNVPSPDDVQYIAAYKEFINTFQYNTTIQKLKINFEWKSLTDDEYNIQVTMYEMLLNYNNTLIGIGEIFDARRMLNNDITSILEANESGYRSKPPKKGGPVRSDMYHWLTQNSHSLFMSITPDPIINRATKKRKQEQ